MGAPQEFAQRYYQDGVDELIYMDIVASLYGRNSLNDLVNQTARDLFVPITVGGGIRSTSDAFDILRAGADKVAINTAAINNPDLVTEISRRFGSQCMVLSVEAKRQPDGSWEALMENGRERTGLDAVDWVVRGVELGAGEILLTSVDQEGTARGMDMALLQAVSARVNVPIIASGGVGKPDHVLSALTEGQVSAVAMAHILHYGHASLSDVRDHVNQNQIQTRVA